MPRIWAWTSKIVIKSLLTSCMCSMLKDIICFRSYCFSGGCSVMIMIHCKPVPLWKKVISQIGFENCFELSVAWHSLLKYIGALHKWCQQSFLEYLSTSLAPSTNWPLFASICVNTCNLTIFKHLTISIWYGRTMDQQNNCPNRWSKVYIDRLWIIGWDSGLLT